MTHTVQCWNWKHLHRETRHREGSPTKSRKGVREQNRAAWKLIAPLHRSPLPQQYYCIQWQHQHREDTRKSPNKRDRSGRDLVRLEAQVEPSMYVRGGCYRSDYCERGISQRDICLLFYECGAVLEMPNEWHFEIYCASHCIGTPFVLCFGYRDLCIFIGWC